MLKTKNKSNLAAQPKRIESLITIVRGHRVILDADLARVYGVTTGRLNEQVKRNIHRFPDDFMFRLTEKENAALISQIAISNVGRGGRRRMPLVFTEHGAIMAANVLNSPLAVQMSVFVVRAFVKMRSVLSNQRELAQKLAELEKKLTERLDVHEVAITKVLRRIMDLIDPPPSENRWKTVDEG